MGTIKDKYGRSFKTLRVSLVNHCNMGCLYCVAAETQDSPEKQPDPIAIASGEPLKTTDLLTIIRRLHQTLALDTVRLTGGEPLLYTGIVDLIEGIRSMGVPNIKLTTNGFLLERMAVPMLKAGLNSINVSLDAVDENIFFQMSQRRSANRIIRGIDAALLAGLSLKVNTVVMKGLNDSQIFPLLDFAHERGIAVRFLEVMAMGHLHDQPFRYLVTQDEILTLIGSRYVLSHQDRSVSATARYWKTDKGHLFGVIANSSEPFCGDCNRLRLDSRGNLFGCLSSNHPILLGLEQSDAEWNSKLWQALEQKQQLRFTGSDLSMLQIGG